MLYPHHCCPPYPDPDGDPPSGVALVVVVLSMIAIATIAAFVFGF